MEISEIKKIQRDLESKKYSCQDLIKARLEKAKDNALNSCISVLEDSALKEAKLIDDKLSKWEKLTDLEWVPFWVKDVFLVQDTKSTGWSKILEHYWSPYTATVVDKIQKKWWILIVKENNDSFWHGSTTENSHFWATKNARNPELVAWWSSGWSAVNVAADITTFSIWEDTWWSIRQPAWYNGVVWLKPTYGSVSRYGCMAYASSLDTVGPIAKSVEDIKIIMNFIWWRDDKDRTSIDFEDIKLNETLDFSKVKIWYYKSFLESESLDSDIKQSIMSTFDKLKNKWAQIEELDFFDDQLVVATYYILAMAETASNLSRIDWIKYWYRSKDSKKLNDLYLNSRFEWFSKETQKRIISGNQVLSEWFSDKYYAKAIIARSKIIDKFKENFKKVDFIISPVTPNKIPKIWESLDDPISMYMSDIYTVWFSLWKTPTIVIPSDSPTGIQITWWVWKDSDLINFTYHLNKELT